MRKLLKKIIPPCIWKKIRRVLIIRDQKRIAAISDKYIDDYFSGQFKQCDIVAKHPELVGNKIIWQYWAQGFEIDQLPEVVKVCVDSVDRHCGDWQVIRLSDNNISDYLDLPEFMYSKRGEKFKTHSFANVLRLALMYVYGGLWLDATVLMTGPVPVNYAEYDFFMYQRDEEEPHKRYWENSFALYFGWGEDFIVRMLTSIIFSKPRCTLMKDWMNLMIHVWDVNDAYPHYFTFPIIYNQLIKRGNSGANCPIEGDCPPHYLMQIINDEFPYATASDAVALIPFHKLTYKEIDITKFRKVMKEIGVGYDN